MPISEVTQTLYKTKHFGIACAYFVNKYKRQLIGVGGGGGVHTLEQFMRSQQH